MKKHRFIRLILAIVLFCSCGSQLKEQTEGKGSTQSRLGDGEVTVKMVAYTQSQANEVSISATPAKERTPDEEMVEHIKNVFAHGIVEVELIPTGPPGKYIDVIFNDKTGYARTNQFYCQLAQILSEDYDIPIFIVANPIWKNTTPVTVTDIQNAAALMPSESVQYHDEELTDVVKILLHLVLGYDYYKVTVISSDDSARYVDITLDDNISHVCTDEGFANYLQQVSDALHVPFTVNGNPIHAKVQYVSLEDSSPHSSSPPETIRFSATKFNSAAYSDSNLKSFLTALLKPIFGRKFSEKDCFHVSVTNTEESGRVANVILNKDAGNPLASDAFVDYVQALETMLGVSIAVEPYDAAKETKSMDVLIPDDIDRYYDYELEELITKILRKVYEPDSFEVTVSASVELGRFADILPHEDNKAHKSKEVADYIQLMADKLGMPVFMNGQSIYTKVQYVTHADLQSSGISLFRKGEFSSDNYDEWQLFYFMQDVLNVILGEKYFNLTVTTTDDSEWVVDVFLDYRIDEALDHQPFIGYIQHLEKILGVTIRMSVPTIKSHV